LHNTVVHNEAGSPISLRETKAATNDES
jgi:hypothetical protein